MKKWKDWSDPKQFIFEDLCVYSIVFVLALFLDHLTNIAYALGIYSSFNEVVHEYKLGAIQLAIMIVSAIQILRGLSRWRYHK